MIISHKYKFIFIHIPKTAGSSIRAVLEQYNYYYNYKNRILSKLIYPNLYVDVFTSWHLRAMEVKRQIVMNQDSGKIFDEYFKFCFVRNPYDWTVSQYKFMKRHDNREVVDFQKVIQMGTFDEFIEWRINEYFTLQKDYFTDDNNELIVDYVGHYENLDEDFSNICRQIGIPKTRLPIVNTSHGKPFNSYYNKEQKNRLYLAYKDDFDFLGYES